MYRRCPMNSTINSPALNSINYRVFWKDRYSSYEGGNPAFLKDAGLEDSEQIVWLSDYDLPWKDHADRIIREDQEIMTGKISKVMSTTLLPMADDALHLIHMQKYPIKTSHGLIRGIICVYYELSADLCPTTPHPLKI